MCAKVFKMIIFLKESNDIVPQNTCANGRVEAFDGDQVLVERGLIKRKQRFLETFVVDVIEKFVFAFGEKQTQVDLGFDQLLSRLMAKIVPGKQGTDARKK